MTPISVQGEAETFGAIVLHCKFSQPALNSMLLLIAVGTTICWLRRVGPGNFTPSPSRIRT